MKKQITSKNERKRKDIATTAPDSLSRRRFLGLSAAALSLPFLSRLTAYASPGPFLPPDRGLSFYNTHTGEAATVEYCRSGCIVTPSLEKIKYILRDHRTGETKDIDVRLLDLLNTLSRKISTDVPFHVISGYRSPGTNAALRADERGRRREQPPPARAGHRHPPSRPQAEGSLQGGGRSSGRRGRDLSGLGFRPRRRRPRPDLVIRAI